MNEVINDEDNIAKTVERNREREERKVNRSSLKCDNDAIKSFFVYFMGMWTVSRHKNKELAN